MGGVSGPSTVAMPARVGRAILEHARREAPRECCGLLLGTRRTIHYAVALPNRSRLRTRYRIDPRDHVGWRRHLRQVSPELAIVGVYHSHPTGPPEPSPTDVAEAHYPEWIHVIATLQGRARTRAFRIRRGRVTPLGIRVGRP